MGSAATSITRTASTTAVIMTRKSSAMPTAVMTESSEKTMSRSMTWLITAPNEATAFALSWPLALELVVNFVGRLRQQEQAAADENQIASREAAAGTAQRPVRREIQTMDPNSRAASAWPRSGRPAARVAAVPWAVSGQDRDEDDVVDPEDDLEKR